MSRQGTALVAALRGALPYIQLFQGRTFVVKVGGAAVDDDADVTGLVEQLALLHHLGIRVVVVHGGGGQINRISERLGIEVTKVAGRRVTDERTLEVATMVLNGTVRTRLLAAFREAGVRAVGVSGVDAGLIRALRRPPRVDTDGSVMDYGLVGDIAAVDVEVVQGQLQQGHVVVVSPISADDDGVVLNINADVVASRIAGALEAEKLVLVTDAPGILADVSDPGSLVVYTDLIGLDRLEAQGAFEGGIRPKVDSIRHALDHGVRRAHVISHKVDDGILLEIFTNEGSGTLVVRSLEELAPSESPPNPREA